MLFNELIKNIGMVDPARPALPEEKTPRTDDRFIFISLVVKNVRRTAADAHFVQSLGAKVNNNKCASAALFIRSLGEIDI